MIARLAGFEPIAPHAVELSRSAPQELTRRNRGSPRIVYVIEDVSK
jgi:hypothetical protein